MNTSEATHVGRSTAGFVLAAGITVLFNTVLACVKDASQPLLVFMNHVAIHNWITQGLADLVLFFGLGLLFSRSGAASGWAPGRLVSFLAVTVILAGLGLFFWYLAY